MSESIIKIHKSNITYGESKHISNKGIRAETTEDKVHKKAEDEVVALILSAILGSIIESWEIVPLDAQKSEICTSCKVKDEEQTSNFNDEDSHQAKDKLVTLQTYRSIDDSEPSNQLISTGGTIHKYYSKEQILSKSSVGQVTERISDKPSKSRKFGNSLSRSSELFSIVGQEKHHQQTLKSLFVDVKDKIYGWELLDTDPEVIILFKQGNRYEGRLVSCRMHGWGKFFWADGSVYEGEFLNGEITGKGCFLWPDQSWYEGQFFQGYRHGIGLSMQAPSFYTGHWKCGHRHGLGSMFYDHNNTQVNYYNGEWYRDYKSGTGMRNFPSGAIYSGQWKMGVREGLGTMVWTNNDVYNGNWEKGNIHGYGEYTWATFFNNQLVVPQENCYYGNWDNGIRHGNGTLETDMGVIIRGTWNNGKKHGPAEVICNNGTFVYASNLFTEDCISAVSDVTDRDSLIDGTTHSPQLYKVPVNAGNQEIDLRFYSERLSDYIVDCRRNGKTFGRTTPVNELATNFKNIASKRFTITYNFSCFGNKLEHEIEESLLRNILLQYLSALKVIYNNYSELCCEVKPTFSTVLIRLMLWQFFRDCNLHNKGMALADFDILIANNKVSLVQGVHYPFERLQFWQFLHCIIEISWQLYGKECNGTPSVQGVLASAFHKLITTDIMPNAGRHKGNALFKYKDLLSLDSVYWFYRGIGEPHPARKLLKNTIISSEENSFQHNIPEYPEYLVHGTNVIGVGGKLTYYPEDKPLIPNMKHSSDYNHVQDLTCLRDIGLLAVFNCLLEVCPSIAANGLIVNMDYKIIFLEFCEILLLCAKYKVDVNMLHNKINEVEPQENVSQEEVTEPVEEKTVTTEVVKTKKSLKPKKKKK